jgi:hypothetical protein
MDFHHYDHSFAGFIQHPLIAFVAMLALCTGSLAMNLVDYSVLAVSGFWGIKWAVVVEFAKSLVPFAQILACIMTIVLGARTWRKLSRDDQHTGKQ